MRKKSVILAVATLVLCAVFATACGDKEAGAVELDAPVLTLNGATVSWESVDHADGYDVYINGVMASETDQTEYAVTETVPGSYEIRVKATSSDAAFTDSELSDPVTYTVTVPSKPRLDKPVIAVSDGVASWDAVAHASSYEVYIGGKKIGATSMTWYVLPEMDDGVYSVTVKATTSETAYRESEMSAAVNYRVGELATTPLAAPEIRLTGATVTWGHVTDATGYEVYINGALKATVRLGSYTVTETAVGRYSINVKAVSSDERFSPSALSNTVIYEIEPQKLAAPHIELDGNIVGWEAVSGATGYEVYIGGIKRSTVTVTSYTLTFDTEGDYIVKVKATAQGYSTSDFSNEVTYSYVPPAVPLVAPVISVNAGKVAWEAVSGAASYDIYVNGSLKSSVVETEYTFAESAFGNYSIYVVASPADTKVNCDSEKSNTVKIVIVDPNAQPIASPSIELDGNTVKWAAVEHAAGYDVYVDSVLTADSLTATSYDLSGIEMAGDYAITVVAISDDYTVRKDSDPSDPVTYTVQKKASHLVKISDPIKTEYFADEAAALDLTGLAAKMYYSNYDGSDDITLTADDIISAYDLSVPGRYELEFEKDGVCGVTVRIYVRERRTEDVGEYITVINEYAAGATEYSVTDGSISPTMAFLPDGSGVPVTDGMVAASMLNEGENLLRVTDGTNSVYVKVMIVRYISDAEQFYAIADDLDGYYMLKKNINFENKGKVIGSAPLNIEWENKSELKASKVTAPRNGKGDAEAPGKLFTGTLDGCGYALKNFKIAASGAGWSKRWQSSGSAIFGGIGEGGAVKNLIIRGANIAATGAAAMIAGYNAGLIENVSVEEDCKLHYDYDGAAIACAYNYGVVRNVVSHVTQVECRSAIERAYMLRGGSGEPMDVDSGINCFIGDKTDRTDVLGVGWNFVPGYGNYYGNEYFYKLMSYDDVWYVGVKASALLYVAEPGLKGVMGYAWGAGAGEVYPSETVAAGSHFVYLAFNPKTSYVTGDESTIMLKYNSRDKEYFCALYITIGAPYAVSVADGTDGSVTAYQGGVIDLDNVDIAVTMTDGSVVNVHPTGYYAATFNKDDAVGSTQIVKFYYDDGRQVFDVDIPITLSAPTVPYAAAIDISKKAVAVSYGNGETPDFDSALTFTVTLTDGNTREVTLGDGSGALVVGEYTPGKRTVEFTYTDPNVSIQVRGSVELDLTYIIRSESDWILMNTYTDGYFALGGDLVLSGATANNSLVIGVAPLKAETEGFGIDGSGVGTARAGTAFTGRFDGGGHKIIGFGTDFAKNEAASPAAESSYALVPFAFIGAGGVVENFTLSGASIKCGQSGSFIAGLNLGTVRNIVIDSDCTLFVHYGDVNGIGAVACVNGGSIDNVACKVTTFTGYGDKTVAFNGAATSSVGSGTVADFAIGADAALKEVA